MSEIEKYYNGEIHVDFDKETIKITQPMFEPGELESFDNYIHSIVEEYSKMKLHEKDQILTQRIIMKQEEEIERLNNIINELEKDMIFDMNDYGKDLDIQTGNIYLEYHRGYCQNGKDYYDKLQELKGSDKEWNEKL